MLCKLSTNNSLVSSNLSIIIIWLGLTTQANRLQRAPLIKCSWTGAIEIPYYEWIVHGFHCVRKKYYSCLLNFKLIVECRHHACWHVTFQCFHLVNDIAIPVRLPRCVHKSKWNFQHGLYVWAVINQSRKLLFHLFWQGRKKLEQGLLLFWICQHQFVMPWSLTWKCLVNSLIATVIQLNIRTLFTNPFVCILRLSYELDFYLSFWVPLNSA